MCFRDKSSKGDYDEKPALIRVEGDTKKRKQKRNHERGSHHSGYSGQLIGTNGGPAWYGGACDGGGGGGGGC